MSKKMIVGAAAGAAAYFLIGKFLIQKEDGTGFIPVTAGFGVDDVALGGGSFLVGMIVANMV